MLVFIDTVRIAFGKIKSRIAKRCAESPAPAEATPAVQPQLSYVYQIPDPQVSFECWRKSHGLIPDSEAAQIFAKHRADEL